MYAAPHTARLARLARLNSASLPGVSRSRCSPAGPSAPQRKTTCNRLTQHRQNEGYTVATLHGDLLPDERDRVMESFRKGTSKVLIATNVLSRGIDVLQVSLVINFDLPSNETGAADLETYLHRIGRTGRFGRVRARAALHPPPSAVPG